MIITCPTCQTRFNVDPGRLLPNGRTVKCTKCGHLWNERPPGDMPRRVDEPELTINDLPEPDTSIDDAPNFFEGPSRRGMAQTLAAVDEPQRSPMRQAVGWATLFVIVLGVLGFSVLARETMVQWWPPSKALFELAGLAVEKVGEGLQIRNITTSQQIEDDKPTLIVAGEVVNLTNQPIDIPIMRGSLLDIRKRVVYQWKIPLVQEHLAAGKVMPFSTSVREPPPNGRAAAVQFFEE